MSVWPYRVRTVANYLRSHSGIAAIQAGDTRRLITPRPYAIDVTAIGSAGALATFMRERLRDAGDGEMPVVIRYQKGTPVDEAVVLMPISAFAALLAAHYEKRVEGRQ